MEIFSGGLRSTDQREICTQSNRKLISRYNTYDAYNARFKIKKKSLYGQRKIRRVIDEWETEIKTKSADSCPEWEKERKRVERVRNRRVVVVAATARRRWPRRERQLGLELGQRFPRVSGGRWHCPRHRRRLYLHDARAHAGSSFSLVHKRVHARSLSLVLRRSRYMPARTRGAAVVCVSDVLRNIESVRARRN